MSTRTYGQLANDLFDCTAIAQCLSTAADEAANDQLARVAHVLAERLEVIASELHDKAPIDHDDEPDAPAAQAEA